MSAADANIAFKNVKAEQKFNYVATNVLAVGSILTSAGVSIGTEVTAQGTGAIAVGNFAGQSAQGTSAIAIGTMAAQNTQSANAIAVGVASGMSGQGSGGIAIGFNSAMSLQGTSAIAIGVNAGSSTQGQNAVAIGMFAGASAQGSGGVAIGFNAGLSAQGANSVAIGVFAGASAQAAGSIVISASGATLSGNATNGLYISTSSALGIRLASQSDSIGGTSLTTLLYNQLTKEILCSTASAPIAKSFIIDHPVDESKYLVHVCLEGPEAGVYYRGVGEIAEGADSATIVLPSYVDKLAKDFTVQVTAVFNGAVRVLNASAVKDGAFTVHGAAGAFSWLVHGSRGAVEAEVVKASVEVKGDGPYKWIA